MREQPKKIVWRWGLVGAVLLLGAALAWHDLGTREVLGRDENATITKIDQPNLAAVARAVPMKVTGQPGNMQPLYFLVQHSFWPLVGRSAFMLRFLPAAFAVLAVAATYKLGEVLLGWETGLAGAFLTALLPLHVQYAQIARPYTLLALLSLASAYFLVRAWESNRPLDWAGFMLAGALNFYNHYNALFVLAAEGLFAGLLWLARLASVLRGRRGAAWLVGPAVGFLALGVLCTPGLVQLASLPWTGLSSSEQGATETLVLNGRFFVQFLDRLGLGTPWLKGLVIGLAVLGLAATLYRRRRRVALLAILWLAVPFAVLAAIHSPRPFVERYVIFVPPVGLILAGHGVIAAGRVVGGAVGRPFGVTWPGRAAAAAAVAALALLFVAPLREYYATNRAADRLGETLTVVERHARAGDAIIVSPRFFVRPLAADGAEVFYLSRHPTPSELDELAGRYQRLWLLFSSYLPPAELQEPIDRWYQAHESEFARVPIKAISAVAYRNMALADMEANLQDRIALLEELARQSKQQDEAWVRYGILAEAYQGLGELYAEQGKSELAEEYRNRAETSRAAVPPPW